MKREDVPVLLFGTVMTVAVLVVIVGDATASLCSGIDLEKLNEGRPVFGCREFWFNRYQTTTQTIVASILTAAGLYFVIRQLSELTNQNKMTARALDGARREQAANRRVVVARAIAGVDTYNGVVGALMLEIVRQIATGSPPKKASEFEGMSELREASAAVYPALITKTLRDQWKVIKREYASCISFIFMNGLPNAPEAFKQQYSELNPIPASHEEALKRMASLTGNLKWLAQELEMQTPDD